MVPRWAAVFMHQCQAFLGRCASTLNRLDRQSYEQAAIDERKRAAIKSLDDSFRSWAAALEKRVGGPA